MYSYTYKSYRISEDGLQDRSARDCVQLPVMVEKDSGSGAEVAPAVANGHKDTNGLENSPVDGAGDGNNASELSANGEAEAQAVAGNGTGNGTSLGIKERLLAQKFSDDSSELSELEDSEAETDRLDLDELGRPELPVSGRKRRLSGDSDGGDDDETANGSKRTRLDSDEDAKVVGLGVDTEGGAEAESEAQADEAGDGHKVAEDLETAAEADVEGEADAEADQDAELDAELDADRDGKPEADVEASAPPSDIEASASAPPTDVESELDGKAAAPKTTKTTTSKTPRPNGVPRLKTKTDQSASELTNDSASGERTGADAKADDDETYEQRQRQAAIEFLTEIEIDFAKLRDQLHDDKMKRYMAEMDMCADGTHPELEPVYARIARRRDDKIELARRHLEYKRRCIAIQTRACREQLHQQFMKEIADSRAALLLRTTEEWYRVNRERRAMDTLVPEYTYRAADSPTAQLHEFASVNHEIALLTGISKYIGFPAAPEIKPLSEDELQDDLYALGLR